MKIPKDGEKPLWGDLPPTTLLDKKTIIQEGPDRLPIHTLTFAIPPIDPSVLSGRFQAHASIRPDMGDVVKMVIPTYKPKSYSISSLRPDEFDVTFKVYPNGRASGYLNRLKIGDTIQSFGMRAKRTRNPGAYVGIIAYGVGITEGLPVARAELEKGQAQKVVLLWASRTPQDTFWNDEIQELENKYSSKFEMVFIYSRREQPGCLFGRIDANVLAKVFQPEQAGQSNAQARFLSIGTKEMMKQTDALLTDIGYPMPEHALLPKVEK